MITNTPTLFALAATIFITATLSSCGDSGSPEKQATINSENAGIFLSHSAFATRGLFSQSSFELASEIMDTHLNQGDSSITKNCPNGGLLTGSPEVSTAGIGTMQLNFEACTLPGGDEFTGNAQLEIRQVEKDEDLNYWFIREGKLTFNSLTMNSNAGNVTVSGSLSREKTDKNLVADGASNQTAADGIDVEVKTGQYPVDTYNVNGHNHSFSRDFRLEQFEHQIILSAEGISVLPALSIGIIRYKAGYRGKINDAVDGYTYTEPSEFRQQVIDEENGNIVAEEIFQKITGSGGSQALYGGLLVVTEIGVGAATELSREITLQIDSNGDDNFESDLMIPW